MRFYTLPYIFYACIALTLVSIAFLSRAENSYEFSRLRPWSVADLTEVASHPNPERGAELWNRYVCCSCQEMASPTKSISPPVAEVRSNWPYYEREELLAILLKSGEQIRQGKPEGTQLWEAVTPAILTTISDLSYRDLQDMLAYVSITG
ncbi:hypothetical protein [Lewinella sp. IMCC34183]|uniref:hypothetical protein n=1 Tax=Lewinella sp. IMCC34183 TaxID=2248762 RepID=UPI000E2604A4|nr:hypothetical protein [Lewinella sp. IMCC34183]